MRWLDQVRQRRAELRLWAQARTLEDLGELTARWLEGHVAHQPGYHGPVDVDEDLAPGMRDTLVRLNRAGFVTNSSQAGYDNASWTSHAAVTGFARDETVQMLRPTLQRAGYAAVTDDYTDKPGGTHVTFQDGRPYTLFGGPLDKPVIEEIYPGVSAAAIDDLCGLSQLTIYDPQTGRNTLWAALDEAVRQPEQEKIVNTYDEELAACRAEYRAAKEAAKRWGDTPGPAAEVQAAEERLDRAAFALADKLDEVKSVAGGGAPRDSVRPGLHNAPGSRYNHDPRVKADGSGGYTVTTEYRTLQVRYDQQHGWGVHNEDGERLSGGHADPDSLIHTLIGAPHRRDTAGNVHGRQPQDNSGPAAAPDGTGSPHGGNTDTNEHAAAENDGVSGNTSADADPSDQGQEVTMNGRDNLTPEQDRLYQGVLAIGRQNGMTCNEVLRLSGAANTDKAAVADAIAGPGAGDEFREQDSQQSRGVNHAGRDNDTTSEAPSGGEQAGRGNADDSADNTGSGSVGAHADAGEMVNIPGDAVGSRGFISDAGGRGSTSTAGTSTAGSGSGGGGQVNIGAVTSRGGQVHAGGDITGQKNTAVPQPRRQAESGSDSGDGW